jgi:molybdopterin biosynthesis enzyme
MAQTWNGREWVGEDPTPAPAAAGFKVGDDVRVIQSKQRGIVEDVVAGTGLPTVTVRTADGYAARYNSDQLVRVG